MARLHLIPHAIGPLIAALFLVNPVPLAASALASPPLAATECAGITLQVHPGINPPSKNAHLRPAWDAPRGTFTVSLPLYPGTTSLSPWVASPYPEYPASPYLQTAGAEYQSTDSSATASAWFSSHLPSCGWHSSGNWGGNATVFTNGLGFTSNTNPDLSVELSFGDTPSGGSYIGYGVEWIIYPPRPSASYLHGPFTQLRIALGRNTVQNGSFVQHVVHAAVRNRTAIRRLVSAINSVGGYHTVSSICVGGGPSRTGPAWLTFRRPNGTEAHAYEAGLGICLGNLAVNGKRWLIDTGVVWKHILGLTGGRG